LVASSDAYPAVAAEKTDDTLTLIDLPGISQETLGKHWAQLTPTERDEFMALFAQLLIHVAFPQSASFFQKLKMTVTAEHIRGEKATVSTYVEHAVEGKIDIDYRLSRENRGWRIYDVELDGVSLSRNLRGQFQQIIRHSSYAELLRRMREKLEHATTPSPS
jgi:phospholipid transport system substrate-binding protein